VARSASLEMPVIRYQGARIAALSRWATELDRLAATAPARAARDQRFIDLVDPDWVLPRAERPRRADHARETLFARLALRSAEVRSGRARSRTAGNVLATLEDPPAASGALK
jgi:hypothetical protein